MDYNHRLKVVSREKQVIGKKAATFLKAEDDIILDASTTVQACAEHVENMECTIITNSINSAEILSKHPLVSIHLVGGEFHKKHRYLFGSQAIEKMGKYSVDKAFIGAVGISESGLTSAHEEDGMLKKKMIQQAKQVIVLADHTKFGVNGFFQFGNFTDIDVLITDCMPSSDFIQLLQENGVELVIASEGEDEEND
jgi:DeoR/GlpR family transcriptional regulator of sugar metabolism